MGGSPCSNRLEIMCSYHRRRNHGGSRGCGAPLYFLKFTLCLHTRSLSTELEPPFIKPCSYAFVYSVVTCLLKTSQAPVMVTHNTLPLLLLLIISSLLTPWTLCLVPAMIALLKLWFNLRQATMLILHQRMRAALWRVVTLTQ